ncbi:alkaline phosphatase family protein [Kutzneria chonburiensis]|uniref:alkaline phosphatase family protein n=1 Tax=Kutzneria chonburiensis TaxID=1483604 RepID=UPI00235F298E|nr:alkaline phosphatase family protein [Kutzneria chonburiensis]
MRRTTLVAAVAVGLVATTAAPVAAAAPDRHVLLISIDGLHAADLAWYVRQHPHSALAGLTREGIDYAHAKTPVPSDSFPGLVGQLTGGNPATTGIYYDATYNHALLPAGTTDCAGAKPGRSWISPRTWTRTRLRWTPARAWPACRTRSSA